MSPDAHELRRELLERISEPDLDLDRAAERVAATRAGRRRRRRQRSLAFGGAAAVLAVALVVAAVGSGGDEELVADGASVTTTTEPAEEDDADADATTASDEDGTNGDDAAAEAVDPSALESLPVEPAPELPPALVTPEPPPPATAAPLPVPPPAVDEPLVVALRAMDLAPAAGEAVSVEVAWLDADHVGGAPMIRVDWGDPLLQSTTVGPEAPECGGAARPAGSVERVETRFASPGPRTIRVEVVGCDGPSGTPQRGVAEVGVTVAPPSTTSGPGRTIVVHAPPGARLPGALDQAVASFRPVDGLAVGLGQRRPTLAQRAADGPASVIVLPGTSAGRPELVWPGQSCRATADLGAAPVGSARLVPLTTSC